jgi:hypothetical protein
VECVKVGIELPEHRLNGGLAAEIAQTRRREGIVVEADNPPYQRYCVGDPPELVVCEGEEDPFRGVEPLAHGSAIP